MTGDPEFHSFGDMREESGNLGVEDMYLPTYVVRMGLDAVKKGEGSCKQYDLGQQVLPYQNKEQN